MHEKRYDAGVERLRSPERLKILEVDRVVQLSLQGYEAASLLDLGTGTGIFAEAFARQGLTVTGLDVSEEMLASARQIVPDVTFKLGEIETLPFEDNSFDIVFMGFVFHETDTPLETLQEARRVAQLGVALHEWPYTEQGMGPPLDHRMKPEEVQGWAKEAGFDKIETMKLANTILYKMRA